MRDLIERIEVAPDGSRDLDWAIYAAFGKPTVVQDGATQTWANYYTTSIDAALTLLPEGWVVGSLEWWPMRPHGAGVALLETGRIGGFDGYDASVHRKTSAQAATPAMALVAAILRARGEG